MKINNVGICPVVPYGLESWTLTRKDVKRFLASKEKSWEGSVGPIQGDSMQKTFKNFNRYEFMTQSNIIIRKADKSS